MSTIVASLVFLVNSQRQIFMGQKTGKIGVGKFTGPGGKCESGETPRQAAVRETHEETGVELTEADLLKVAEIIFRNGSEQEFLVHIYFCYRYSGFPANTEELTAGTWFKVTKLIEDPRSVEMMAGDYIFLPLILSGQKLRGWCEYEAGSNQGIVLDCHYDIVSSFAD